MRISDTERREVAQKLREDPERIGPGYLTDGELLDVIAADVGVKASCDDFDAKLMDRLADLIEPQSVEPEAATIYVGPDSREMDVWACPACGEVVSYDFDDYDPKTDGPRYCSGCGRKVAKW